MATERAWNRCDNTAYKKHHNPNTCDRTGDAIKAPSSNPSPSLCHPAPGYLHKHGLISNHCGRGGKKEWDWTLRLNNGSCDEASIGLPSPALYHNQSSCCPLSSSYTRICANYRAEAVEKQQLTKRLTKRNLLAIRINYSRN